MYTGWQMLLLDVLFMTFIIQYNEWVNQPNKLIIATISLLLYLFLNVKLSTIPAHS